MCVPGKEVADDGCRIRDLMCVFFLFFFLLYFFFFQLLHDSVVGCSGKTTGPS